MTSKHLKTFLNLSKIPTTSFHENLVSDFIKKELFDNDIKFEVDQWGNIEAYVPGELPNELVFISHMDHPGFEIIENIEKNIYKAKCLGALPRHCEMNNTAVKTYNSKNQTTGKILPSNEKKDKNHNYRWLESEHVLIELDEYEYNFPTPVVFSLPAPMVSKDHLIVPVADDLAGCALILESLKTLNKNNNKYSFRAIFSRAEEVGLYGARLIAKSGKIHKESIIISVETSSELPGAYSGNGPIIRTGDRISTFDNLGEIILLSSAKSLLKKQKDFKFQRQLMSSGGCEASAFLLYGYKVTGIALPLINWHNCNPEGYVESEKINILDYENALKIMTNLGKLDIVEFKDYYNNLIEIPDDAYRLENKII
jgi:putative aminopeptidase FrvX